MADTTTPTEPAEPFPLPPNYSAVGLLAGILTAPSAPQRFMPEHLQHGIYLASRRWPELETDFRFTPCGVSYHSKGIEEFLSVLRTWRFGHFYNGFHAMRLTDMGREALTQILEENFTPEQAPALERIAQEVWTGAKDYANAVASLRASTTTDAHPQKIWSIPSNRVKQF